MSTMSSDRKTHLAHLLSDRHARQAPWAVRGAVTAIFGATEINPELVLCVRPEVDAGTTWNVLGIVAPAGLFVVDATSALSGWSASSRGDVHGQVSCALSAQLFSLARIVSMTLDSVARVDSPYGGDDELRYAWTVRWADDTPDLVLRNDTYDTAQQQTAAVSIIEYIRAYLVAGK